MTSCNKEYFNTKLLQLDETSEPVADKVDNLQQVCGTLTVLIVTRYMYLHSEAVIDRRKHSIFLFT